MNEINTDLWEIISISKDNLELIIERDVKLNDINRKSKLLLDNSINFYKSTEPWYKKYKYYMFGGIITTIGIIVI